MVLWEEENLVAKRKEKGLPILLIRIFSVDNLINDSENSVVELQNHELNEQLILINQLDEDEKNALVKIINSMLTKKRMKDLLDGKVKF